MGVVTRNRLPSAAAVLAAVALAVLAPAAPARAHTQLTRTTPAAESTVTEPVTEVTLTFSGLVKSAGATVAVTGPDEVSYSDGAAQAVDRTVTQQVRPLPPGEITVAWRTVASDGHSLQGSFTFTNEVVPPTPTAEAAPAPAATPEAPAPSPAATPVQAGRNGDDEESGGTSWGLLAVLVGVSILLAGGVLWRRLRLARRG